MTTLHISLDDGFNGQSVAILVNGRLVCNKPGVTTDLRTSRAAALDTDVEGTLAHVAVVVEPDGLQASVDVDSMVTPYLCIDIAPQGAIAFRPTQDMPRYF